MSADTRSRFTRLEAMLFRSDSVRFQACPTFHPGHDLLICTCGWLEEDHPAYEALPRPEPVPTPLRRPRRRRTVELPERRAS